MAEKNLTDNDAQALANTTDSDTGVTYPEASVNNWLADRNRMDDRLLDTAKPAGACRVYEVDGNADAIGVYPGTVVFDGSLLTYAGSTIDGLTDNDTTYIWLESDGGGGLQIDSAVDGTGWPANSHWKLAEVTMASAVITGIVDKRTFAVVGDRVLTSYTNATRPTVGVAGRIIFNTDDGQLNIDDGTNWTLPDGTTT